MLNERFCGLLFLVLVTLASGCIGDDFIDDAVDPVLRITNKVDSIGINESYQLEKMYLNNVGRPESVDVSWASSNPAIVAVNDEGLATAFQAGQAEISVSTISTAPILTDQFLVNVGQTTVASTEIISGEIVTTSSYVLEGDFEMEVVEGNLQIRIADNYRASTALPGLYIYLGNNRNTIADALEVGAVEVFNGAHSYTIEGASIADYGFILYWCKPFNIKVGEAVITP